MSLKLQPISLLHSMTSKFFNEISEVKLIFSPSMSVHSREIRSGKNRPWEFIALIFQMGTKKFRCGKKRTNNIVR